MATLLVQSQYQQITFIVIWSCIVSAAVCEIENVHTTSFQNVTSFDGDDMGNIVQPHGRITHIGDSGSWDCSLV